MSDIPTDIDQAATRIASKYLTLDISRERLYHDVVVALLAERLKAANAALEEAANLIEDHIVQDTSAGKVLKPRQDGNRDGLAYAAAIRSLREEE